jgi:hypothetical protein
MSRIARKTPTVRLNLEMHEEVRQRLERLRDETHADTLAEVVRRALSLYDLLWKRQSEGGELIVRRGEVETQIELY